MADERERQQGQREHDRPNSEAPSGRRPPDDRPGHGPGDQRSERPRDQDQAGVRKHARLFRKRDDVKLHAPEHHAEGT